MELIVHQINIFILGNQNSVFLEVAHLVTAMLPLEEKREQSYFSLFYTSFAKLHLKAVAYF